MQIITIIRLITKIKLYVVLIYRYKKINGSGLKKIYSKFESKSSFMKPGYFNMCLASYI